MKKIAMVLVALLAVSFVLFAGGQKAGGGAAGERIKITLLMRNITVYYEK